VEGIIRMEKKESLVYSWSINRAYSKFCEGNNNSIEGLYNSFYSQLKENFFSGYSAGHEDGYHAGMTNEKLKMMVKLAVHTNLDDNQILKILERENEDHFILSLREIREKQKNQY
jgi:hypothetical protein